MVGGRSPVSLAGQVLFSVNVSLGDAVVVHDGRLAKIQASIDVIWGRLQSLVPSDILLQLPIKTLVARVTPIETILQELSLIHSQIGPSSRNGLLPLNILYAKCQDLASSLCRDLHSALKSIKDKPSTPSSKALHVDSPSFTPLVPVLSPLQFLKDTPSKHPRNEEGTPSPSVVQAPKATDGRPSPGTLASSNSDISDLLFKVISVFKVDNAFRFFNISHNKSSNSNSFVLLDLFQVSVTPAHPLSIYEAVLLSIESGSGKGLTSVTWASLLQQFRGPVKFDLQRMQSSVRKLFPSVADNAISPICEMSFNDYLVAKRVPKNKWDNMPANHGIGEPALIAQTLRLNISIIWLVGNAWHLWCLPYGGSDPFVVLLYSNTATTSHGACLTISAALSVPRFFACDPLVDDWENSKVFCEAMPESQHEALPPIKFRVGDKEFALQSVITVEGSVGSESGSSEITTASQFFNDFVDDGSISPDSTLPTPPEIAAANIVRLEAKIVHIRAVNALNAQFIRRRRIVDDDDSSEEDK